MCVCDGESIKLATQCGLTINHRKYLYVCVEYADVSHSLKPITYSELTRNHRKCVCVEYESVGHSWKPTAYSEFIFWYSDFGKPPPPTNVGSRLLTQKPKHTTVACVVLHLGKLCEWKSQSVSCRCVSAKTTIDAHYGGKKQNTSITSTWVQLAFLTGF